MNIKNKIMMSFVTGVLGVGLISGGTFAYFSAEVDTTNKIQAGTLDLGISDIEDDGVIFEFFNKKPGSTFKRSFTLTNDGSLDIKDVKLFSEHTVRKDGKVIEDSDFASQIVIKSLKVNDEELITETTLDDLEDFDIIKNFEVDEIANIDVVFAFIESDDDQNQYQGNKMELDWKFVASQTVE
ncbi:TasA family protein [Virgibacillus byunsanensis]|uniref:TasA family protein n=1 Tax=Virgibacillus byunsanensis TaxID=570945 RepID=A0ABW3LRJ6_9BACI